MLTPDAPLQEVVQVAEAPGDEAEAGDAEESIKDLGVDFDPDAARRVEIVAVFDAVQAFGVAHILTAAADKEQEQHPTPGNNVETVDGDQKTEGRDEKLPKPFEANEGGFAPGVLWREFVAVGVDAVCVRPLCWRRGR